MKYTLLKMVQLILSAMDSDEVNDINDTVESRQVVDVIETTYNDIVSIVDFPEHWDLFELQPSGDPTRPTLMYLPDGVAKLDWIQYDNREDLSTVRDMKPVTPLVRGDFFYRMNGLNSAENYVYRYDYLVGAETFDIRGRNDMFPTYYTVISDNAILFDSYRADIDTTLQGNKTMCYGMKIPIFTRSNTFVPDLDARNFTLLFNEAKSQAFIEIKQVQNAKADQRARRALVHTQRTKTRAKTETALDKAPNFGRRR